MSSKMSSAKLWSSFLGLSMWKREKSTLLGMWGYGIDPKAMDFPLSLTLIKQDNSRFTCLFMFFQPRYKYHCCVGPLRGILYIYLYIPPPPPQYITYKMTLTSARYRVDWCHNRPRYLALTGELCSSRISDAWPTHLWALVQSTVNLCVVRTSTITFLDQNWYLFTILAFDIFQCLYLLFNTTRMRRFIYMLNNDVLINIFQFKFLKMVNANIETCANATFKLPLWHKWAFCRNLPC